MHLFLDDLDPLRFYVLPIGLDVKANESGEYNFSLIFYQSDNTERGARLNMTLFPQYPEIDMDDVKAVAGEEAEVIVFSLIREYSTSQGPMPVTLRNSHKP